MGALTSIASAAVPLASTALQQQYRTQSQATQNTYDQQALERRYAEERQARLEEWQREDQLRAAEAAREAEQRRADMTWLAQSQNLEIDQLRTRQETGMRESAADAQTKLATLSQQAAGDERVRRDALRRAVSRTRADLGGQGVSAADGSGEAILLGLVGESAAESRSAAEADRIKRQAVQQELDNARRRNLLEQAQLAQRQRLEFMSKYF